jgi:hypothetical protein
LECLRIGAMQKVAHERELGTFLSLIHSPELEVLAQSIAVHRADCQAVGIPFHYSATSNANSKQALHKSEKTFKQHRKLHSEANSIKHAVDIFGPPPAAPPCLEMENAIECIVLEASMVSALGLNPYATPFVPFSGDCSKLPAESLFPGLSVYRGPARIADFQVDISYARFPPPVSRPPKDESFRSGGVSAPHASSGWKPLAIDFDSLVFPLDGPEDFATRTPISLHIPFLSLQLAEQCLGSGIRRRCELRETIIVPCLPHVSSPLPCIIDAISRGLLDVLYLPGALEASVRDPHYVYSTVDSLLQQVKWCERPQDMVIKRKAMLEVALCFGKVRRLRTHIIERMFYLAVYDPSECVKLLDRQSKFNDFCAVKHFAAGSS